MSSQNQMNNTLCQKNENKCPETWTLLSSWSQSMDDPTNYNLLAGSHGCDLTFHPLLPLSCLENRPTTSVLVRLCLTSVGTVCIMITWGTWQNAAVCWAGNEMWDYFSSIQTSQIYWKHGYLSSKYILLIHSSLYQSDKQTSYLESFGVQTAETRS